MFGVIDSLQRMVGGMFNVQTQCECDTMYKDLAEGAMVKHSLAITCCVYFVKVCPPSEEG